MADSLQGLRNPIITSATRRRIREVGSIAWSKIKGLRTKRANGIIVL